MPTPDAQATQDEPFIDPHIVTLAHVAPQLLPPHVL